MSRHFLVYGADRYTVADHFVTCAISKLGFGDVMYGCLLDSKGLLLDDCFVRASYDHLAFSVSWTANKD